ncbi:hypothetical protein Tco_1578615 [Tanacetum coccineum]
MLIWISKAKSSKASVRLKILLVVLTNSFLKENLYKAVLERHIPKMKTDITKLNSDLKSLATSSAFVASSTSSRQSEIKSAQAIMSSSTSSIPKKLLKWLTKNYAITKQFSGQLKVQTSSTSETKGSEGEVERKGSKEEESVGKLQRGEVVEQHEHGISFTDAFGEPAFQSVPKMHILDTRTPFILKIAALTEKKPKGIRLMKIIEDETNKRDVKHSFLTKKVKPELMGITKEHA